MKATEFRKLIREEVKKALNKSSLNEAKKEKFLLYTNPNNSTNRAYVAIGSAKVKDVMGRARKYSGSYDILHQGNGTNDDLQKAIKMFRQYNFGDVSIAEGFLGKSLLGEGRISFKGKNTNDLYKIVKDDPRSMVSVNGKLYSILDPDEMRSDLQNDTTFVYDEEGEEKEVKISDIEFIEI